MRLIRCRIRPEYDCTPTTLRPLGMTGARTGTTADLAIGFPPGSILMQQQNGRRMQPDKGQRHRVPASHSGKLQVVNESVGVAFPL